jgi:hypothetical protein
MTTTSASIDVARARRQLRWVAIAAAIDFLLLVPLVIASVSDADDVIHILGPIHGIGFLIQLFLTVRGAGERLWGWWFPLIVVVTGGPPGALIGHVVVSRQLDRAGAPSTA